MNPNHNVSTFLWMGVGAFLVVALAACGGESSSPPPSPPPPPPFQPQAREVKLGEHGGTLTLMTAQGGGYTRDGQPFTSGDEHTAENGNKYRLTLAANVWTAEFLPPDPVEVRLGSRGGTIELVRTEDPEVFTRDGELFESGTELAGDHDNAYRVTFADGAWTAEFLPPDPVEVRLGSRGGTIELVRTEDPEVFTRDGELFESGTELAGDHDNAYRVTLANGMWTAEFLPPDPVEVRLGSHGGTIELVRTEDPEVFTRDGELFESGTELAGDHDNAYRVTLANGMWTAEFLPPDPVEVRLGSRGGTIELVRTEDPEVFTRDGELFESGTELAGDHDNTYRLTLADGAWTADYIAPDPVPVVLGNSGNAVLIKRNENGSYVLTEMGEETQITVSHRYESKADGNQYFLRLVEGRWTAEFLPRPEEIRLGNYGGTLTFQRNAAGEWELGGRKVEDGQTVTGVGGRQYRLKIQTDGSLDVVYLPEQVSIPAGESGDIIVLVREEDGTLGFEGEEIESGQEIELANGNTYILRLRSGAWVAEFQTGTVTLELEGTDETLVLVRREDGTYTRNGRQFRVPGGTYTTARGRRFIITVDDDGNLGSVELSTPVPPDPEPGGGGGSGGGGSSGSTRTDELITSVETDQTPKPTFKQEDGTDDMDEGVTLVVGAAGNKVDFSIDEILGRGTRLYRRTYVASARARIEEIRREISLLTDLFDLGAISPHEKICGSADGTCTGGSWKEVRDTLAKVFGSTDAGTVLGEPNRGRQVRASDVDDVLEKLDEIIEALASERAFIDEVENGIFEGLTGVTDSNAERVYATPASKMWFGSDSHTRFGAYAIKKDGSTAHESMGWDVGAFAYSPLEQPARANLPSRGEAIFEGDTVAVDSMASVGESGAPEPKTYAGDIELKVRFGSGRVTGTIQNLRDENDDRWVKDSAVVESIRLPNGALTSGSVDFSQTGDAILRFTSASLASDTVPSSSFAGKFVGDDDDDADAAIGTWELPNFLKGSYGADYRSTSRAELPAREDSPRGSRSGTETAAIRGSFSEGKIALGGFTGSDAIPGADLYADRDGQITKEASGKSIAIAYEYTNYTRFGAWLETRNDSIHDADVFAYSPLTQEPFNPTSNPYPAGITGTYTGETMAVDLVGSSRKTYRGTIRMTVAWNADRTSATFLSHIQNLRATAGGAWFQYDGTEVESIELTTEAGNMALANLEPSFEWTNQTDSFRVHFRTSRLRALTEGTYDGLFVGSTIDGPAAVIGTWSLMNQAGDTEVARGAYGADLQP